MVKNKDLPDSAAHPQSGLSLCLCVSVSPTPFILRVALDPADAGPRHLTTGSLLTDNNKLIWCTV